MADTRNHKYAKSSSNNYIIMMIHNLQRKFKIENLIKFAFSRHEVPSCSKQQPRIGCSLRDTS